MMRGKQAWIPVLVLGAADLAQRGLDYSTGDTPKTGAFLSRIERGLALEWWGVLCILAAGIVLAGVVWKSTRTLATGAICSAAVYAGLAVGRIDELILAGWPPDGWRSAVHFSIMAAIWCYAAGMLSLRDAIEKDREERRGERATRIANRRAT